MEWTAQELETVGLENYREAIQKDLEKMLVTGGRIDLSNLDRADVDCIIHHFRAYRVLLSDPAFPGGTGLAAKSAA